MKHMGTFISGGGEELEMCNSPKPGAFITGVHYFVDRGAQARARAEGKGGWEEKKNTLRFERGRKNGTNFRGVEKIDKIYFLIY